MVPEAMIKAAESLREVPPGELAELRREFGRVADDESATQLQRMIARVWWTVINAMPAADPVDTLRTIDRWLVLQTGASDQN